MVFVFTASIRAKSARRSWYAWNVKTVSISMKGNVLGIARMDPIDIRRKMILWIVCNVLIGVQNALMKDNAYLVRKVSWWMENVKILVPLQCILLMGPAWTACMDVLSVIMDFPAINVFQVFSTIKTVWSNALMALLLLHLNPLALSAQHSAWLAK